MPADDIGAARTRAARKAVEQKGLCIFILPRLDVRRCNASNVVNADYKLRLCNPTVMAATSLHRNAAWRLALIFMLA